MAAPALDAVTERVAANLLRHLEWQAEGFSLVFLFADVGPSLQMADWLDQRLKLQGRPLRRHESNDDFTSDPEAAVDALIAQIPVICAQPGGYWFGLQRHPGDTRWNEARRRYLARLNERRFLLERDFKRPLIPVLPSDFISDARSIAPDIWHVRALSEELRVAVLAPEFVRGLSAPHDALRPLANRGVAALPAYDEWPRMHAPTAADRIYLPTAWRACRELLSAGRPADAAQVALVALTVARQRAATQQPTALRDLSVSLDNVGQVARARGDWTQAEAVYRESLDLSRQLVGRLGGTPEALEDLAVSLSNLADIPSGNIAERDEAIQILESLIARFPSVPSYAERLAALHNAH